MNNELDFDAREGPIYRIVSGKQAQRGHHPWQATIRTVGANGPSAHNCGASVLTRRHVITAAHCVNEYSAHNYAVRVGDHFTDIAEQEEREVFVERLHIHEHFRRGHHISNNDIAIVELKQPLEFNDYVQPICLPSANAAYKENRECTISGWGSIRTGKSGKSSRSNDWTSPFKPYLKIIGHARELRSGKVPLIADADCKQEAVYGRNVTEVMFCAGYLNGDSVDACEGDSGGPLVCEEEGEQSYATSIY